MAQVVAPPNVASRIDDDLDYLFAALGDLPEVAAEWVTWDEMQRLDFLVEWDIKRDRLGQLKGWDEQRLLTDAQRERYRDMLQLLDRRRPILERLLAD